MKPITFFFIFLLVSVFDASAEIEINTNTSVAAGNNVRIISRISSTYQLSSVVATLKDRTDTLTYNVTEAYFEGSISLSGIKQGTYQLSVTAKDVFDNHETKTVNFLFDQPPTIIAGLLPHSVARPQLPIVLKWDDLDICTVSIEWRDYNLSGLLYSGKHKDSLNITVDLARSNGRRGEIWIFITDKKNQETISDIPIYVDSSSTLTEYFVANTPILDFNYNRVLVAGNGLPDNPIVTDITTGQSTVIPVNSKVSRALITPYGALLRTASNTLYDWNRDSVYALDVNGSTSDIQVAGDYAIWDSMLRIAPGSKLTRRNLATLESEAVTMNSGTSENSVAANGVVAFFNGDIYKYENGVTTNLTANSGKNNNRPRTDGNYFVYNRQVSTSEFGELRLITPAGDSVLSNITSEEQSFGTDEVYQVNNKFVAYAKLGIAKERQLFVRDSFGNHVQRTFFGSNSVMELLNNNGEIAFRTASKRHLSFNNGQTEPISSVWGKPYYNDSGWFVAIGRVLFKVADAVTGKNPVWTGKVNKNWNNPANWTCNCVPAIGANITVPPGGQPVLNEDVVIGSLALDGSLDIAGHSITINGAVAGNGNFTGSPTSSMIINGNAGMLNFTQPGRLQSLKINGNGSAHVPPGSLTIGP
ncbi:hypothetical protein [Foetidibacter luteolus]|uniref:hypothetical protein n=1 Tax=Foetidibacter luteolus TaxID=2608880 RepID=UPI00129BA17A|nr:hypothetical protein [Foetidibacter luteolus]